MVDQGSQQDGVMGNDLIVVDNTRYSLLFITVNKRGDVRLAELRGRLIHERERERERGHAHHQEDNNTSPPHHREVSSSTDLQ